MISLSDMKNKSNASIVLLGGISAILLSLPFLIPHLGWVSLFALVPLLWAEKLANDSGMKHFWLVHYGCFLIFNALTTWWVCNATVGGGIFASVANAFQMSVVFALFRLCRRRFRGSIPYIFLFCAWIAWERMYFDAQISWPWLVLGNAFARSLKWIQWYEYTGTLGGSLWIWLCNLAIFGCSVCIRERSWQNWNLKARLAAPAGLLLLFIFPPAFSLHLWKAPMDEGPEAEVFIAQPNIDPYHKFEYLSQSEQTDILCGQIREGIAAHGGKGPLLILAPETFTNDVFLMDGQLGSVTVERLNSEIRGCGDVSLIVGASSYEYISSKTKPSPTARRLRDGMWVESHNSALLLDGKSEPQIYHKSKLVVAVEMTPYPKLFCKIDDMLGGVMGRCIGQKERGLLYAPYDSAKIAVAPVICYESIYGEYCCDYVRKGAQMLAIITNDAWWKDTAGYRQHLSYASLRAIETRRWIARCGNTGISAFIDSKGRIVARSNWWQKETLDGSVRLCGRETFFVKYGDMTGRSCTLLFLLLGAALLVRLVTERKKRN